MSENAPLDDGTYDAFVVDAEETDDGLRLEVAIVAGAHKGRVVDLDAPASLGAGLDLLGMPATLTVADGHPTLNIDT